MADSAEKVNDPTSKVMNLDLTETTAITELLKHTIDSDRYPLSPRIRTLQGILNPLLVRSEQVFAAPARRRQRGRSNGQSDTAWF